MRRRDTMAERIAAYPWPRGGVEAEGDRVEVLRWRRGAWGPAGPFGASFGIEDALAFIASEPAFWIRA
jgi:hypothetical protein